jgi:hypothetical protein
MDDFDVVTPMKYIVGIVAGTYSFFFIICYLPLPPSRGDLRDSPLRLTGGGIEEYFTYPCEAP